jgi:hypothetical protein
MASWTLLGSQINGLRNGDQTGWNTVASADGNTIVVSSQGVGNGTVIGYVRVYTWNGSSWAQKGSTINGFSNGDYFGGYVSITDNGLRVAISAFNRNAVYIYDYNSGTNVWDLVHTFSGISGDNAYGYSVNLTPDGTKIVISSLGNTNGYVQVYTFNGSSWVQRGSNLTPTSGDGFGWQSDISDDGNSILIGQFGTNSAYVYVWNGSSWQQRGSTLSKASGSGFGISVSMNSDGTVIAVGAPFTSGGGLTYVYTWNGSSWVQRGSNIGGSGGRNIKISPDGTLLANGKYAVNSYTGAIDVWQWNGSAWTQIGSTINGVGANQWFGFGCGISANGFTVVGGAPELGNGGPGFVRTYRYTPSTASSAVDLYANGVNQYITNQTMTTDSQKTTVAIDTRAAIKAKTSNFSTAQKTDTQKSYIDSMRSKGINTFTLASANFTSFKDTLASVSASATAKNVDIVYPNYVSNTATVDAASANSENYLHIEVPINYSFTLQNGAESILLTFNGTAFTSEEITYNVDSSIVLGDKTFTLHGIGSAMFEVSNSNQIVCIVKGSMIQTPSGDVPIENLHTGDIVVTGDGREVPIISMKQITVVAASTNNAPYVIEKDAFGINYPSYRLEVSPRHAIQLKNGLWEIPREAAKVNPRVYQKKESFGKQVVYYHFALPNYATDTTIVNGTTTEVLNDGKYKESYVWNNVKNGYERTLKTDKPLKTICQ